MPTGPSPAASVPTTRCARMSMTEMSRLSGFETNTLPAREDATTPAGERPTSTVATTCCDAMSITDTSLLPWLVIQANGAAKLPPAQPARPASSAAAATWRR